MITVDVSAFHLVNVTDTCAVWNILGSPRLLAVAEVAGCHFPITTVVLYECLHKPRTVPDPHEHEQKRRLRDARARGGFSEHSLTIGDLQDVARLEQRKRLAKGELASIAFANRTGNAFCTDDQKARQLAADVLGAARVQTTPHLLGWLVYTRRLADSDVPQIIEQHERLGRPLRPHFLDVYEHALQCRLMGRG